MATNAPIYFPWEVYQHPELPSDQAYVYVNGTRVGTISVEAAVAISDAYRIEINKLRLQIVSHVFSQE